MHSQLRLLLWKEWRERRVQLGLCLAFVLGGLLCCQGFAGMWSWQEPISSWATTSLLVFVHLAPIFVAMRTALGENRDRTRSFSDGLPLSVRLRSVVRWLGGVAVLVLPILAVMLLLSLELTYFWPYPIESSPAQGVLSPATCIGFLGLNALLIVGSLSTLYGLLAWLGTWLRNETHLGFVGAVVACLWLLLASMGNSLQFVGASFAAHALGAINPEVALFTCQIDETKTVSGMAGVVMGPLAINLLLQVGLAALFVRRYAAPLSGLKSPRIGWGKTTRRAWPIPLSSPGRALAWLALREAIPLTLPGLAIAGVLALFLVAFIPDTPVADVLPSSISVVGVAWASVVGAGLFSGELDSRGGEFWRTRPISTGWLFATKCLLGLFAVLVVLDGTALLARLIAAMLGLMGKTAVVEILNTLLLHALMYAIAVAWTCVLRRAVLGGLASILSFLLLASPLMPHSDWSEIVVLVTLVPVAVAAAYLALQRYRPAL